MGNPIERGDSTGIVSVVPNGNQLVRPRHIRLTPSRLPTYTRGPVIPPALLVSRQTLSDTATNVGDQQLNVAAAGSPIGLLFGRNRIAGKIMQPVPYQGDLLIPMMLGAGVLDGIEASEIDNKAMPAGVTYTFYSGTLAQTADPLLVAAWAALGKTYADTLPGIAYVVMRVPKGAEFTFQNIAFILRGFRMYDPRQKHVVLGSAGQYASTPDTVATSITGDLDLRAHIRAVDYTAAAAQVILAKETTTTTGRSYRLQVRPAGTLLFAWSPDGTAQTTVESAALPVADGVDIHVRVTFDVNNGAGGNDVRFYTSPNGSDWTQLGTTITTAGVASIFNSTAALHIGGADTATTSLFNGRIYRVRVYNGIDGTLAADFNLRAVVVGATSFASPTTGETWTVNGGPSVAWVAEYTNNATIALSHFLNEPGIGPEETMDWLSVAACADLNDQLCGVGVQQEKRRTIGIFIDQHQTTDQIEDLLRAHAGVWVVREAGVVYFVADAPATSDFHFTKGKYRLDSIQQTIKSRGNAPTLVTVQWTDTSSSPWKQLDTVPLKADGVDTGVTPWIESAVPLPGCQQPGQAYREQVRRLNEFVLCDLQVKFVALDEGAKIRKGSVFELSDFEGFNQKPFRCIDVYPVEPGRWAITGDEYQAAVYSDSPAAGPGIPDTTSPDPRVVAAPTLMVIDEIVYLERNVAPDSLARGFIHQSRFDVSVTPPVHAYPFEYRWLVSVGGLRIYETTTAGPRMSTPPVQQDQTYVIDCYARSLGVGASSPALTGSKVAQGKLLKPGPVPAILEAFEASGDVIVSWLPAVDIDIQRYEWRYFPNGTGTWATATFIDRVDGFRARFPGLPVGTHRFYVRPLDSVGQYSDDAAANPSVDITINTDADAFLQSREFVSPTLTNMVELPPIEGVWKKRWATSVAGQTFNAGIAGTVNAVATPIIQVHASGTSLFVGESWDLGAAVAGDWTLTPNTIDVNGVATYAIETSPNGSTWTSQPGKSFKGTARFVRPVIQTLTTGTFVITAPPKIALASIARREAGSTTTLGSGGKLVSLGGKYSFVKNIQATPINSSADRNCSCDRILVYAESGLMLKGTSTAGDAFLIQEIYTTPYTVQAGDFLEYDVYIDSSSPAATTFSNGGMQITFADASNLSAINDADGYNTVQPAVGFDALARGMWKSRRISLATKVGIATASWRIRHDSDGVGLHKTLFRNIRITNASPTTQPTAYTTSGEPAANTVFSSALTSNNQCGPSNSFMVYGFQAGAQTAIDAQWAFEGT